jgi:uncharacterized membrane protein YbjE (DUF340 family)
VCQRRLLAEWGLGMLPAFLMLVSQTVLGADGAIQDNYGQPAPEVWAWFSPLVMPTLLLILGVVGAQVHQPGAAHKRIERFYYRLAFTFAALYLGIINVLVIGVPLMGPAVGAGFLTHTSLFLGPLQGVVGASVGTLVVKAAET